MSDDEICAGSRARAYTTRDGGRDGRRTRSDAMGKTRAKRCDGRRANAMRMAPRPRVWVDGRVWVDVWARAHNEGGLAGAAEARARPHGGR